MRIMSKELAKNRTIFNVSLLVYDDTKAFVKSIGMFSKFWSETDVWHLSICTSSSKQYFDNSN